MSDLSPLSAPKRTLTNRPRRAQRSTPRAVFSLLWACPLERRAVPDKVMTGRAARAPAPGRGRRTAAAANAAQTAPLVLCGTFREGGEPPAARSPQEGRTALARR
jgi:hypothetical protein